MRPSRHSVLGLLVVLAMTGLFWAGCSKEKSTVVAPDNPAVVAGPVVGEEAPVIRAAIGWPDVEPEWPTKMAPGVARRA